MFSRERHRLGSVEAIAIESKVMPFYVPLLRHGTYYGPFRTPILLLEARLSALPKIVSTEGTRTAETVQGWSDSARPPAPARANAGNCRHLRRIKSQSGEAATIATFLADTNLKYVLIVEIYMFRQTYSYGLSPSPPP